MQYGYKHTCFNCFRHRYPPNDTRVSNGKLMSEMSLKPMFANVAKKYDLLNRILTVGLDETWRDTCARKCSRGDTIVDLCCGTGDLSLHILKYAGPRALVVGVDFSKAMLRRAVGKVHAEQIKQLDSVTDGPEVNFVIADASRLPFKDGVVDSIGISFSLRNLVYRSLQAETRLKEVSRTLKPNGRFVCVETSQPRLRPVRALYHLYLMRVVPFVGWLVSRRKNEYNYLGASAANFPPADEIADKLLKAGFRRVSFRRLALGAIALHISSK